LGYFLAYPVRLQATVMHITIARHIS